MSCNVFNFSNKGWIENVEGLKSVFGVSTKNAIKLCGFCRDCFPG